LSDILDTRGLGTLVGVDWVAEGRVPSLRDQVVQCTPVQGTLDHPHYACESPESLGCAGNAGVAFVASTSIPGWDWFVKPPGHPIALD
jgi:hypothetical protein